jgi:hypothetical protein
LEIQAINAVGLFYCFIESQHGRLLISPQKRALKPMSSEENHAGAGVAGFPASKEKSGIRQTLDPGRLWGGISGWGT